MIVGKGRFGEYRNCSTCARYDDATSSCAVYGADTLYDTVYMSCYMYEKR